MRFCSFCAIFGLVFLFGCQNGPKLDTTGLNGNPDAQKQKAGSESTFNSGDFDRSTIPGNVNTQWQELDKPVEAQASGVDNAFISNAQPWTEKIYFDYNRHELKPSQREILDKLVALLNEKASQAIVIEGHCDERGSAEYNRALGERRSLAVKKYLADSGIAEDRMFTISYGSDKPEVADAESEADHAKNRRCQFLIGVKK